MPLFIPVVFAQRIAINFAIPTTSPPPPLPRTVAEEAATTAQQSEQEDVVVLVLFVVVVAMMVGRRRLRPSPPMPTPTPGPTSAMQRMAALIITTNRHGFYAVMMRCVVDASSLGVEHITCDVKFITLLL